MVHAQCDGVVEMGYVVDIGYSLEGEKKASSTVSILKMINYCLINHIGHFRVHLTKISY